MKFANLIQFLPILLLMGFIGIFLNGCNENAIEPDDQTDDQYLQQVVTQGVGSSHQEDEDLIFNEVSDFDDGGAVGGNGDNTIDSLVRWGRKVTNVNISINIVSEGDSLKNVFITRTINGYFIIIGVVSGQMDTIVKPYTEVFKRNAVFKRIAHSPKPRYNWKLYKISMVDGETSQPQAGSEYVQMNKVEV